MIRKYTFPRSVRLRARRDIREVFARGTYCSLGPIGVRYRASDSLTSRFLVSVKKSVGNAPCRNRIKRLLRECLRRERGRLRHSYDICLFVSRPLKYPLEYGYVSRQINKLIEELKRLPVPEPENPAEKWTQPPQPISPDEC